MNKSSSTRILIFLETETLSPLSEKYASTRSRFQSLRPGGVRTTIAKHHGRYSKSDHLCQGGVGWTSRLRSEYSLITL